MGTASDLRRISRGVDRGLTGAMPGSGRGARRVGLACRDLGTLIVGARVERARRGLHSAPRPPSVLEGPLLRALSETMQTAENRDGRGSTMSVRERSPQPHRRVAWTSPGGKRRPLPWSVVHAPTQPTRARHPRRDRSGATCAAPGENAGEEEPRDPAAISSGRPVPPRPSRRTLRRCGRSSRPRRGSASTSARRGARRASGSIRSSRT